jgi:NAD(P)H-hydrate repair Nnr-like enzyme with NAD(P)H-hydrate epimerase domain
MMVEAVQAYFAGVGEAQEPTVRNLIDALQTIPEILDAKTNVMAPVGKLDNPIGEYVIFHGAGTNGGYAAAKALFEAGVNSVVYIHLAGEDAERLRQLQLPDVNVVVSGHIASDMIGINRYVAELERRGIEVIRMSGL